MELEKFSRQLRLLLLLVKNRKQTIDEVSAQLGMSRRSMYRYIDAFRKLGFIIKKEGMVYRIDHESDFYKPWCKASSLPRKKPSSLLVRLIQFTITRPKCVVCAISWHIFTTLMP